VLVQLTVVVLHVISHLILQVESDDVARHFRERDVNVYFEHVLPVRRLYCNLTLGAWR